MNDSDTFHQIPIMIGSKLCHTKRKDQQSECLQQQSECMYDQGGYFIVKGNEKVIVGQERLATNHIHVLDKDNSFTAEIRSITEHGNKIASQLLIRRNAAGKK
jgi:DNA-directed RNA polymerase II subunit RPB2